MNHYTLPIGAVVIFRGPKETDHEGDVATLTIVQHSKDCDGSPLYMAAKRPIAPPPDEYKLYSRGYLAYALTAGWFVGNAPLSCFTDTGKRVKVERFEVERYA